MSSARKIVIVRHSMSEQTDGRAARATALCLASMTMAGAKFDMTKLLALADEYLAYIDGDDFAPIPRPDKIRK